MRKNIGHELPADDPGAYTVRVDGMTGLPNDRDTATRALLHLLRLGYGFPRVALLRWDDSADEWKVAEVETLPSRLTYVNRPIRNTVGRSG